MTSHRNKATSKWPRSSSFFSKPAFKCCAPLFDNITSIEPDRGELTLVGFSPAPQGCQHIHMMLPWPSLWAEVAYFTKSYTRLAMCSSTALPRTFSGIANHVPSSKFVCSEQMWAFRKCRVCETFQGATEGHRIFLWGQQQFWFQTGPSRKRICVIHTSLTSATCSTPSIIIEKCSKHFSPEAKCLLTPFPPQVSRSTHENWLLIVVVELDSLQHWRRIAGGRLRQPGARDLRKTEVLFEDQEERVVLPPRIRHELDGHVLTVAYGVLHK